MIGNVMGGKGEKVTTSGWVLPAVDGKTPRYAIAWSGLVYPLTGDSGPADLDADVRALKGDADAARTDAVRANRPIQRIGFNGFGSNSEDSSIAVKSLHPIKVCLLLRLGRADLAEQFWAAGTGLQIVRSRPAWFEARPEQLRSLVLEPRHATWPGTTSIGRSAPDIAATTPSPWPMSGARCLGLAVDTKAEAMGFSRPDRQVPAGQVTPYIEFLTQLPEFREDQERRRAGQPATPD